VDHYKQTDVDHYKQNDVDHYKQTDVDHHKQTDVDHYKQTDVDHYKQTDINHYNNDSSIHSLINNLNNSDKHYLYLLALISSIINRKNKPVTIFTLKRKGENIYDPKSYYLKSREIGVNFNIGNNFINDDNDGFNIAIKAYKFEYRNYCIIFLIDDKTIFNGSYSYEELIFFYLISRECRKNDFLRIHIANNSGARVGIYDEIIEKKIFKGVEKGDKGDVKNDDFINDKSVNDNPLMERSGAIFQENKIISIFGNTSSGPENLVFSALAANETVKAFNSIFTLTYVSGMSVGIGAY
ncbi:Acetyl-CoA carboxylase, partial [Dictyocoela roeselum]